MTLLQAIARLNEEEVYLLVENVFKDRTFDELSKEFNCHRNTVYNRIKRIKAKIQVLIKEAE